MPTFSLSLSLLQTIYSNGQWESCSCQKHVAACRVQVATSYCMFADVNYFWACGQQFILINCLGWMKLNVDDNRRYDYTCILVL